jgi:hypothetical protein
VSLCRARSSSSETPRTNTGSGLRPATAIIAVGEAYESKAAALNGIDSVKRHAVDAAIDDQTD